MNVLRIRIYVYIHNYNIVKKFVSQGIFTVCHWIEKCFVQILREFFKYKCIPWEKKVLFRLFFVLYG